ncbi:MAG TPA: alpha/beta hydrolase [Pseudonocardiaceae bacterium]|jgi:pimeloyl-ACP methyl ester carboxylesterase|nr:alpha/beta hydrolase [Pseudonocardiaceae bacterium]
MTVPAATSRTFDLGDELTVTVDERGDTDQRTGMLVLHGGAGPRSVAGLSATLAEHNRVLTPTHPGFDGTPRAAWCDTIADLAVTYLDLIDELGLTRVLVLGSSIGGWIASEMATRDIHQRLSGVVLLNAVGIRPDDSQDMTDTRTITPVRMGELAFHNPALRPNPAEMSEDQRAAQLANQETLALYGGESFLFDPKLRRRVRRIDLPVLAVWGLADGVATERYGRTFAGAFPRGQFAPIPDAAHFPHLEQPGPTLAAIDTFIRNEIKPVG